MTATVIKEKELEFTFGDTWEVCKYDKNGSYYKTKIDSKLECTKAVDFICLSERLPLLLIEVKDCRKGNPDQKNFPYIVALKVRDTLAGIIGGSHQAALPEEAFFRKSFRKLPKPPRVIFIFEDSATSARRPPEIAKNKRSVWQGLLKQHLRWLTNKVHVVGLNDYDKIIEDLKIRPA